MGWTAFSYQVQGTGNDILKFSSTTPNNYGPALDSVSVIPLLPRTISGAIALEGAVNATQPVTFLFNPTNGGPSFSRSLPLNADKSFALTGIPGNAYTVHIKGSKWLAKNVSVDATNGDVSGVTATLLAGDANNDNSVDSTDFGVLIGAFGGNANVSGSGYDARADFNGDGFVDSTDFGLLIGNFNGTGDN